MTVANPINSLNELDISPTVKHFINEVLTKGVPLSIVGYEFEKTKQKDQPNKKKNGQFYTPEFIVQYMIGYLQITPSMKIIDPACGTGSFLLPIIEKLVSEYHHARFVYGIDLDKHALDVLKAVLHLKNSPINLDHFIHGNTIVSNQEISTHALNLPEIIPGEGFDVVVGNPPYVTLKKDVDYDPEDKTFSEFLSGKVNAASLMIVKSLSILKNNGILAFVLPKNLLHVGSYSKLRKYLLTETTILHLVDLRSSFKNVKGEQIILFVLKKQPDPTHKISIKIVHNQNFSAKSLYVEQKRFLKLNKIYVFDKEKELCLVEKLTRIPKTLSDVTNGEIFRGVSIPASSLVNQSESLLPYIVGKDIGKFTFNRRSYVKADINHRKFERILRKKIVAQNIFSSESGLISALVGERVLTNETVTNIIIEDDRLAKYILGLLNSKLANFYLIYGCYNCSKVTMHTDKEYLGSIPVIFTEDNNLYSKIIEVVDQLTIEKDDDRLKNLKRQLDKYFFSIYELTEAEVETIRNGLDLFLSKKSRW